MKVETFSDLIVWTREMHHWLAECLAHCSTQSEQELARMLLTYLADHEAALEKIVDGFMKQADPKALNTWVFDYLGHEPIDPHRTCDTPFAQMSVEEICEAVFDFHNQVINLYRYLLGRAEIPEARELLQALLEMEEHETMRLAQQSNRIRDM
ncbi:hypothetical protein SAMN05444279_12144 [Ruegeria intermedia]|uniref:ATPase n=1 Tax=Ruegeria intermedia TaxID=996115 RepID=A0A1M4ZS27_9RHOB|nr:ATPase [Ruegeria intermedia]SHF20814.1 hypothetical protein SAMN05444279_12144 [Ruegeria intermedia]